MTPDERELLHSMAKAVKALTERYDGMAHAIHVLQERLLLMDVAEVIEESEAGIPKERIN